MKSSPRSLATGNAPSVIDVSKNGKHVSFLAIQFIVLLRFKVLKQYSSHSLGYNAVALTPLLRGADKHTLIQPKLGFVIHETFYFLKQ